MNIVWCFGNMLHGPSCGWIDMTASLYPCRIFNASLCPLELPWISGKDHTMHVSTLPWVSVRCQCSGPKKANALGGLRKQFWSNYCTWHSENWKAMEESVWASGQLLFVLSTYSCTPTYFCSPNYLRSSASFLGRMSMIFFECGMLFSPQVQFLLGVGSSAS